MLSIGLLNIMYNDYANWVTVVKRVKSSKHSLIIKKKND